MDLEKRRDESSTAPVDGHKPHTLSIEPGTGATDLNTNRQKPPDLEIHTTTANGSTNTTLMDDPESLTNNAPAPLHTVFTRPQRLFIVVMTTLASFFSPLSGQIYFPAIPDIANDYHTTTARINLTITTYMILQGLAPTIMGTFGDTTGRRPAYILTFTIYLAANIGLAVQNSYAACWCCAASRAQAAAGPSRWGMV